LTCLRKTIIHWRDRIQIWKWKTTGATCSDGIPERHLSILRPVIYYYFAVEAPSVSNIPSFFPTMGSVTNGQRRKNLFLFPECHGSPREETTRALASPSPFPIKEQRKEKSRSVRMRGQSDGIHFLCHPLTEKQSICNAQYPSNCP
jgi:hypothetical protein